MYHALPRILFKVYDGPNTASPLLGTFGNKTGPDIVSTGPFLFLRFTSDGSLTNKGFRLSYSCEYRVVDQSNVVSFLGIHVEIFR